jgi:EmrB/QacA subfamily drug resistance transporter
MIEKAKNHWLILIILALAQFMVVLDSSIVNVALPAIEKAFHMNQSSLQWIVTAYTLAFGGFLLLGGRAADLYGRKRMFLIGTAVFGIASLIDGLATSGGVLIALRAAQGLAAALMSPAALSIVLVTYREGHERNTALSVWGAVAAGGAAGGVLLGGIITEYLGWRWNFLVNVPIAAAVFVAALRLVPSHESEETHNDLDLPGAISITAALMILVYGLVEAPSHGWTSVSSLGYFAVTLILLTFFYWNEKRSKNPLVPFDIFKNRNVTAANLTQLPITAGMFSVFFFTSLYVQQVLHYSSVKSGFSFLVIPITIGITATQAPRIIKKIGYKPILMVAPLIVAVGLFLLGHIRVQGNYVHDILPGFILMGLGMGATFVSLTIAATTGVVGRESGLASGLLNTSQQIGGALGLAILTGIASSRAVSYVKHAADPSKVNPLAAQVHGFQAAYYIAAVFMIGAAVVATVLIKQQKMSPKELDAATSSPVL